MTCKTIAKDYTNELTLILISALLCANLSMAAESKLVILSGGAAATGEVSGDAVLAGAGGGDAAFGVSMSVTVGQPFITVLKSDGSSTPQLSLCSTTGLPKISYMLPRTQ